MLVIGCRDQEDYDWVLWRMKSIGIRIMKKPRARRMMLLEIPVSGDEWTYPKWIIFPSHYYAHKEEELIKELDCHPQIMLGTPGPDVEPHHCPDCAKDDDDDGGETAILSKTPRPNCPLLAR